jgi:hypothetical protein
VGPSIAAHTSRRPRHFTAWIRIHEEGPLDGVPDTVLGGLAYGVDAHAHRAALTGRQAPGPAATAVLATAICANGLTTSEMPPGIAPTRYRFLMRNGITAALAGVVCV